MHEIQFNISKREYPFTTDEKDNDPTTILQENKQNYQILAQESMPKRILIVDDNAFNAAFLTM